MTFKQYQRISIT